MPENGTIVDPSRPESTRHEHLSTSPTPPVPLALVSAPQASLVVTTLDDVVDATDGLLSLREAVTLANASAGLDTITFADDLLGGTIRLDLGNLQITDDLVIDGDRLDRGAGGLTLVAASPDVALGNQLIAVDDARVTLEDMTLTGGGVRGFGTRLPEAVVLDIDGGDVTLERVRVSNNDAAPSMPPGPGDDTSGFYASGGIGVVDGSLTLLSSEMIDNGALVPMSTAGTFLYAARSEITFIDSVVSGHLGGDFMTVRDSSTLSLQGSSFNDNWVYQGVIAARDSDVHVDRSAFIGNYNTGSYGTGGTPLRVYTTSDDDRHSLSIVNSTVAENGASYSFGIISINGNIDATITNSTITGNYIGAYFGAPEPSGGAAISAGRGAVVTLENNVITGNLNIGGGILEVDIETLVSNGANIFGDVVVPGAAPGDRLGVDANEVFATTDVLRAPAFLGDDREVSFGVAADNGGPTLTVALLDDPANPALDAADPAAAPAVDQRGFLRDATPDIGAFELGATPALVVTTLDDVVDATDGVLSLREAVTLANANPNLDTITFADDLRGGTLQITGGEMAVTDHLIIDGDPADGGAGGISLRGDEATLPQSRLFKIDDGIDLTLEDLTLASFRGSPDASLVDGGARVSLVRGNVSNIEDGGAFAGSSALDIVDSTIDGVFAVVANSLDIHIVGSTITNNIGVPEIIYGDKVSIKTSIVSNNFSDDFIIAGNDISIAGSTIAENTGVAGAVWGGNISIINSTLVDNTAFGGEGGTGAAIAGAAINGTFVDLLNVTITGNVVDNAIEGVGSGGVRASYLTIGNTIVTGNLRSGTGYAGTLAPDVPPSASDITIRDGGSLTSNGANIVGEEGIAGLAPGDRTGVTADQVFATTTPKPGTGLGTPILAGVATDNGGPTLTVALLDDPANSALDAADPADAPLTDQRGFARDATPDIGAFELGAESPPPPPPAPPLPELAEKVPLADADIFGAPRGFLTLTGGDAEISFVDEFAAFQSSLGVYLVGPDETIADTQWVFEQVEHAEPSDLASQAARPGGGPLSPGGSVRLSDLFDPTDLGPGVEFGLFLVTDGWTLNPQAIFDVGTLEFRTGDAAARLTDTTPQLFHIAEDGIERLVLGDIMHTIDAGSPNPLSNTLNPTGEGQVTSGLLDGLFTVAFEDKPLAQSDRDFNDAIFAIDLLDSGDDLFAAAAVLETLLTPGEVYAS